MAWSFVGTSATVEATATPLTLTEPAGVADGDLLVATISSRSTATTAPTATGWTAVGSQNTNNILSTGSAIASGAMLYRVRSGTPTLAFTLPAGISVAQGRITAYRGSALTPLEASTAVTAAAGTAVSVTGLTTTQASDLIVAMTAGGQEATWASFTNVTSPLTASGAVDTTTAPSTTAWIKRAETITTTGVDTSLGVFDAVRTSTGATGNLTVTASISAGHVVIAGAFKISGTGTADAWNANDKSANITLSASDKTATRATTPIGAVRSTQTNTNGTAGKYYAEWTVTSPSGAKGLLPLSSSVTDTTLACQVLAAGTIFINLVNVGSLGAFSSGNILCMAWDAGAERIWFRKGAGNWNNTAGHDPATGTGGLDASFATATPHALWASFGADGEAATIRTELAEFTQAVPSGFTSWMGEASGPTAYTLPAVAGAYALTGTAATPELGRLVTATAGAYALTGADASLTKAAAVTHYTLPADAGSYALTGATAGLYRGRKVLAVAGSYGLSGAASSLEYGREAAADAGAYALSGQPTSLELGKEVLALAGSYALTGAATALIKTTNRSLAAVSGTYTLTGTPVNLLKPGAYAIIGLPGAYTLTGVATSLEWGREVLATAGSYALTGTDTSLEKGREVAADPGSYALTGTAASLERGRAVAAVAGSYALSGNVTSLEYGREILAAGGSYALSGAAATFLRTRRVTAVSGSYAMSGLPVNLLKTGAYAIIGLPGSYALTGQPATLSKAVLAAYALVAAPGSYALTGSPASLIWSGEIIIPPGSGQRDGDTGGERRRRRPKIFHIIIAAARKVIEKQLPLRKKRKRLAKIIAEEVLPQPGGLLAADKLLLELMIRRQLEQIPLTDMHTEGWYQLQDQLMQVITDAEQTAQLLRAEAEEEDDLLLLLTS